LFAKTRISGLHRFGPRGNPFEHEAANQERRVALTRATLIGVAAIISAECLFKVVELAFRLLQ